MILTDPHTSARLEAHMTQAQFAARVLDEVEWVISLMDLARRLPAAEYAALRGGLLAAAAKARP